MATTKGVTRKQPLVAYHRNGVGGEGFYVIRWNERVDGAHHRFVGTLFVEHDAEGNLDLDATRNTCRFAVLDVNECDKDNIAFAQGNSWRGDNWVRMACDAVASFEAEREAFWAPQASEEAPRHA